MKGYWDDDCKNFSELLWKPPFDIKPSTRVSPFWNCNNKNISFTHFRGNVPIHPNITFNPYNDINKSLEKNKLFYTKFNTDIKRLIKLDSKKKSSVLLSRNTLKLLLRFELNVN